MKKFRILLIALLMTGSVTAIFAFSQKTAVKAKTDTSWFLYDPHFSGGTANPDNYVIMGGTPDCNGAGDRCAIEAPVLTGDQPDLDHIIDERLKQ